MDSSRRAAMRWLAAGAVGMPALTAFAQQAGLDIGPPVAARNQLQVMDFEPLAQHALPPAHWGYLAGGSDDDLTQHLNAERYRHIGLRPRRLVDVSRPDLRTTVFGKVWDTPLFVCPVGHQVAFHAEGELATARAARARRHQMILSNVSTFSIEDVAGQLGEAPWQQLYMPLQWAETERLVKRIEDAGCPVLVWTVDLLAGRNVPGMTRAARQDGRNCLACHVDGPGVPIKGMTPMFDGLEGRYNPNWGTWETVDRLRRLTRMKLVIKGLDSAEDAGLAVQHGADGIIVSNHGGRSTETLRATIDCLPEVVGAVKGQIPVFVDGGVRHGADIYKALALGAAGVGIGRPAMWGLAAFGQAGVERVLEILANELRMTMMQMGTPTLADITAARIQRA